MACGLTAGGAGCEAGGACASRQARGVRKRKSCRDFIYSIIPGAGISVTPRSGSTAPQVSLKSGIYLDDVDIIVRNASSILATFSPVEE